MNNTLRKFVVSALAGCTLCLSSLSTFAQTVVATDICRATGVAFVFFNGVQTTPDGADVAMAEFRRVHGTTSPKGDPIRYEKLYNYSNGFEDFVETFEQRLLEQEGLLEGRFELFFEALNGDGPWWSKITEAVASTAEILNGFANWYSAAAIRNITTLFANPPTSVNYLEHRARIENLILEGKKILLVAHSQGNLFVNPAYNYALTKTSAASVKVVHLAPASALLNGSHALADLDLAINGLRLVGNVASVTDSVPGFLLRPVGVNGKKDALGHGLLEIYLNASLATATRIKSHINDAFDSLVAPQTLAASGVFSATLTWDGIGDVDLHTYEPGGAHVYYARPTGSAGYLDVDNTRSYGPEHYYATCSATTLQTGTYRIAVANYDRAQGRIATVQIASWSDGVLGTKSVTVAAATGDIPAYELFNVVVSKDAQSGKFSVALGD